MIGRMLLPPMMRKEMDTFFERHPELKGVYPCDDFRDRKSVALEDAIHRLTEHVASIGCELRRLRCPAEPDMQMVEQGCSESSVEQIEEKSDWMTLKDVSREFGLPYNSLKSRRWRLDNKFPYAQINGPYSHGTCNRLDVENWLRKQ